MKDSKHDYFLRQLFAAEELEQARRVSLEKTLHALRSRRRGRALIATATVALVVAFSISVALHRRDPVQPRIFGEAPDSQQATDAVRIIDDARLLALFADRGVALVGVAGNQQLVFLQAK